MSTPRITLALLRGACKDQRAIFRKEWPKGADVTIANVQRALELGLDLDWGTRWFTSKVLAEYERQIAPLWAEYLRQEASLWAEYQRQRAPLWAEYERQSAPLRAEYERQRELLWAEYQRQRAPLLENYYLRHATLWVEAFLKSQGGIE